MVHDVKIDGEVILFVSSDSITNLAVYRLMRIVSGYNASKATFERRHEGHYRDPAFRDAVPDVIYIRYESVGRRVSAGADNRPVLDTVLVEGESLASGTTRLIADYLTVAAVGKLQVTMSEAMPVLGTKSHIKSLIDDYTWLSAA